MQTYYALSAGQIYQQVLISRMLLTFGQTHADARVGVAEDVGDRFAGFVKALGHTALAGGAASGSLTEQITAQRVADKRL